jgi:hypothetical protein
VNNVQDWLDEAAVDCTPFQRAVCYDWSEVNVPGALVLNRRI